MLIDEDGVAWEQVERNTRWQKTFKMWLEEQGFETSMYYQMD
jgi:hypothetical protein